MREMLGGIVPLLTLTMIRLRTVPTIVVAHTFCASPDTRISYRRCLLILGLHPRDTAAMLVGNTIQFIFAEFA